jgi:hypothetical protein
MNEIDQLTKEKAELITMLRMAKEEIIRLKNALYPSIHKRRPYFEVKSESGKKLRQNQMREMIEALNKSIKISDGIQIGNVELYKMTEDIQTFKLSIMESREPEIFEMNSVDNCILVKDDNFLSDKKYHNVSRDLHLTSNKIVKTKYAVRKEQKRLDKRIQIHQIANTQAYFYDMQKTIKDRIHFYLQQKTFEKKMNPNVNLDREIVLKISFDGTNIGKKIKVVNFTFCLINEKKKAQTASGNYTLGTCLNYNGLF